MTTASDVQKVKALLTKLRDAPVNSADGSDDVLAPVFSYLMKVPSNSSDQSYHWFCSQADQATVGAATFLLRLFAYNSPRVDEWKARLLTEATRYFGAFSNDILRGFYKSFDDWELKFVKEGLSSAGISDVARSQPLGFA
ncbi:hypothetical protein JVU11DRAFT_3534 [Chiua virens]|nr:hypothetical protein JVU11DRAFT_3534 [Chiua virens]